MPSVFPHLNHSLQTIAPGNKKLSRILDRRDGPPTSDYAVKLISELQLKSLANSRYETFPASKHRHRHRVQRVARRRRNGRRNDRSKGYKLPNIGGRKPSTPCEPVTPPREGIWGINESMLEGIDNNEQEDNRIIRSFSSIDQATALKRASSIALAPMFPGVYRPVLKRTLTYEEEHGGIRKDLTELPPIGSDQIRNQYGSNS